MKKNNVQSWVAGLIALPVLYISGCGQDKTLDQYNHDKAQQDLAKVQSVSGTYNGILLSSADKSTIGPLSIALVGGTQISNATQGSTSVQQATLRGTITVSGTQKTSVEFVQGFYDSDNGTFQIDVPVTLQSGATSTIDLAGSFDGSGAMNGTLKILGYTDNGGYFSLGKDAALPQVTPSASISRNQTIVNSALKYQGKATSQGSTADVVMSFNPGITNHDQNFANLFNPVKLITVSLTYDAKAGVVFTNAQWDQRTGIPSGVIDGQSSDNTKYESVLICNQTTTDVTKTGWKCHYSIANGSNPLSFDFVATPGTTGGQL